jgi:hypothetical protein
MAGLELAQTIAGEIIYLAYHRMNSKKISKINGLQKSIGLIDLTELGTLILMQLIGFDCLARRRMKTLYQQLGVTPLASPTAIQQSYFRLIKKHESKDPRDPSTERRSDEFTAIKDAYRTLSNLELRAEYDRSLQQQSVKPGIKKQ